MVYCSHRSDRRIWVCILHELDFRIKASRTSHIIAFGYLAPITAFSNCFLANGVMKWGLYTKNDIKQKFWAHMISVTIFLFALKYLDSRENRPQNTCVSSDELSSFFLFPYFRPFESYALFLF